MNRVILGILVTIILLMCGVLVELTPGAMVVACCIFVLATISSFATAMELMNG